MYICKYILNINIIIKFIFQRPHITHVYIVLHRYNLRSLSQIHNFLKKKILIFTI